MLHTKNQRIAQPTTNSVGINASKTVKIITSLIPIAATSLFAFLITSCTASCACSPNKARQSESRQYVSSMNRAQQAYHIEFGKFSNSIDKLGLGIKTQTKNYNYSTRVKDKAVFNYGLARNSEIKSYIGGVFLVPATDVDPKADKKELTTLSIVCESNTPGIKQLSEPTYRKGKAVCGTNSRDINS